MGNKGSRYCFFHDPDKEEARKQARFRGGVLKPRMGDGPIRLESAKDVSGFVAELINGVRMRKVDKATASILSTLSKHFFGPWRWATLRSGWDSLNPRRKERNKWRD